MKTTKVEKENHLQPQPQHHKQPQTVPRQLGVSEKKNKEKVEGICPQVKSLIYVTRAYVIRFHHETDTNNS